VALSCMRFWGPPRPTTVLNRICRQSLLMYSPVGWGNSCNSRNSKGVGAIRKGGVLSFLEKTRKFIGEKKGDQLKKKKYMR